MPLSFLALIGVAYARNTTVTWFLEQNNLAATPDLPCRSSATVRYFGDFDTREECAAACVADKT